MIVLAFSDERGFLLHELKDFSVEDQEKVYWITAQLLENKLDDICEYIDTIHIVDNLHGLKFKKVCYFYTVIDEDTIVITYVCKLNKKSPEKSDIKIAKEKSKIIKKLVSKLDY